MNTYFTFASLNGNIIPSKDLPIPQSGIGVLTTIKIRDGVPLLINEHLQRLTKSIKALKIKQKDLSSLEKDIRKVIQKNEKTEAAVRVTLINGKILIHERALPMGGSVKTITITDERSTQDKNHKVIDRSFLNQSTEQAHQQGADDALLIDSHGLSEATFSNIFSINKQGQIITPPIKGRGLNGISRQLFIKALSVEEENIPLNTTEPLVLMNTLRMSEVISINGKEITNGKNLLQKLQLTRDQMEEEYLKNH